MSVARVMRAAQFVIEGRTGEGAALARALRDQAVAVDSAPEHEAAATTERLTASLLEVLASVVQREPTAFDRALAYIEEARQAGRPAWMAAGRAVAARIMFQSGMSGDVLTMLALAELDLEAELDGGRKLDPPDGPTGPGAAANNLGVIYYAMGLMDRAERHLLASVRASTEEYGPDYRGQACVDLANLLAFRLAYAIEKETDEDTPGAAEQARAGLALVGQIAALAPEIDWPALIDYARILELGCMSVADPASVPPGARHEVRAILDTSPEGGLLHDPLNYFVLARLCRQAGDTTGTARAVELAAENDHGDNGPELTWARREAALTVAATDSPALAYARAMRHTVCRNRTDLASALEQRIEMVRLERSHAEVRAAREQLERALDAAGEQEARLQEAAEHDALTGLLNRTSLQSRLARALQPTEEPRQALAVAFIDLDGFKQVNDLRGHVADDALLAAVATGLRGAVRETDTLARYGGDEFVCLREGLRDTAELEHWAERLRLAVEEASVAFDPTVPVTASIGLCVVEDAIGRTPTQVIAQADAAMYEAKRQGPGRLRMA
jgi:diguanylate cyclase (GGDEF)-like protein